MLGSFYPGFMYGCASDWLKLVTLLEVNSLSSSTSLTSPTITRIVQLSPDAMSVLTNVYGLDISGGGELIVDNHSIAVGSSSPTLVVIRSLLNNNITLVTSQDEVALSPSQDVATINPSQDYDIIHTLTYASSGGTAPIRLYRGSGSAFAGTGIYGAWSATRTFRTADDSSNFLASFYP